ncbi:MAG: hypothetical protein ON057_001495 [Glomeribacter sp. 1016415]|nr:hypothetical protein [Glomeribacter sp. 1016415]
MRNKDKRFTLKILGLAMETVNIKTAEFLKVLWHTATIIFTGMTLCCMLDIIKTLCLS